ncbi:MAG: BspA family leucine-rich repeat surface protein [Bacilli bacterium]|nr:BspA family leucine-rich repeat surface protein [Bacilli bacterium]
MIGTLNKTLKVNDEVVSEVPDYLIYTVMYSDGVEVEENHKLEAGTTETYLVRLEFSRNIEELPSATTIQTSLEPQYLQADNTSVVRPAATFIDGKSFNARIKKLAGNSSATYTDDDITITAFRKSSIPPDMNVMTEDNLVSSEGIIYAWFDNGTIYYYSSNPKPYLNEDSSYMFYQLIHISILEVDSVNTSNVTTMASMFYKAGYSVISFSLDVSNWDTSHVTDMSHMFDNAGHDATTWTIGDLSNWDTRNVVTMSYMFCHAASFYNISWRDAGNLKIYYTDISHMFFQTSSANITLSLYDNPRSYSKAFYSTASHGKMIINYTSAVTNIDAIIASAEAGSVITKGELITE